MADTTQDSDFAATDADRQARLLAYGELLGWSNQQYWAPAGQPIFVGTPFWRTGVDVGPTKGEDAWRTWITAESTPFLREYFEQLLLRDYPQSRALALKLEGQQTGSSAKPRVWDPGKWVAADPQIMLKKDPLLDEQESVHARWRDKVDSAAEAAQVAPLESLPDDLASRVSLLGRMHEYWSYALEHHAALVADEERKAKLVGWCIAMPTRQEWLRETHYLQSQLAPIAGQYAEARGEADARLVSQRWRPDDPTSNVQAIMREVAALPYQVVAAALPTTATEEERHIEEESEGGEVGLPSTAVRIPSQHVAMLRQQVSEALFALRADNEAEPSLPEVARKLDLSRKLLRYRLEHWAGAIDPSWHWAPADEILAKIRAGRVKNRRVASTRSRLC